MQQFIIKLITIYAPISNELNDCEYVKSVKFYKVKMNQLNFSITQLNKLNLFKFTKFWHNLNKLNNLLWQIDYFLFDLRQIQQ